MKPIRISLGRLRFRLAEEIDVKRTLGFFRNLLVASWPTVLAFEEQYHEPDFNDFRIDWLQGNWEFMVERNLFPGADFLQIYGEGADCNGASSRVLYPDKIATHHIVCHPKKDGIILTGDLNSTGLASNSTSMVFESFVTLTKEGWFEEAPDFDCVIAYYGDTQVLFKYEDADFSLERIT